MTIAVGDKIPSINVITKNGDPVEVDIAARVAGKKAVIFGLPGAYTGTCTTQHVPSFIRTADAFAAKGVEEIICLAVNDAIVMEHWGETTGATAAGITMAADWEAALTKAMGLEFTVPAVGLKDRTKRCAMYLEDGEVKVLHIDEEAGTCVTTAGEALLAEI